MNMIKDEIIYEAGSRVRDVEVGPDGSKAKIVRKWRKIKEGQKAYEMKARTLTT